jgi:hypothetical protein
LNERWIAAFKDLLKTYGSKERFSMIDQESAINSVTDRIINNTFALKPISSILLQGSVVDEKRMIYRGVDVFVVPDIPPEIGVKYTCTYMDPVDELVLSALG